MCLIRIMFFRGVRRAHNIVLTSLNTTIFMGYQHKTAFAFGNRVYMHTPGDLAIFMWTVHQVATMPKIRNYGWNFLIYGLHNLAFCVSVRSLLLYASAWIMVDTKFIRWPMYLCVHVENITTRYIIFLSMQTDRINFDNVPARLF